MTTPSKGPLPILIVLLGMLAVACRPSPPDGPVAKPATSPPSDPVAVVATTRPTEPPVAGDVPSTYEIPRFLNDQSWGHSFEAGRGYAKLASGLANAAAAEGRRDIATSNIKAAENRGDQKLRQAEQRGASDDELPQTAEFAFAAGIQDFLAAKTDDPISVEAAKRMFDKLSRPHARSATNPTAPVAALTAKSAPTPAESPPPYVPVKHFDDLRWVESYNAGRAHLIAAMSAAWQYHISPGEAILNTVMKAVKGIPDYDENLSLDEQKWDTRSAWYARFAGVFDEAQLHRTETEAYLATLRKRFKPR